MTRTVIVIVLIYHNHKPTDFIYSMSLSIIIKYFGLYGWFMLQNRHEMQVPNQHFYLY
jgi:hypothetical protein